VGRLGLGVGVKTSGVMLHGGEKLGHSGSVRVRVGDKTSLVTNSENEILLMVPSPAKCQCLFSVFVGFDNLRVRITKRLRAGRPARLPAPLPCRHCRLYRHHGTVATMLRYRYDGISSNLLFAIGN